MPHHLFAVLITVIKIYHNLRSILTDKKQLNVKSKDFQQQKFGLWINTQSSGNSTLRGSGRAVKKSKVVLHIEDAAESNEAEITFYV